MLKYAKSLILISALMVFAFSNSPAQKVPAAFDYHEMALLFSQYDYVGSARIQGLGNTQISLGGDISSALSNPAGLGFYQKSEFSITPSFNILNTESKYLNNLTADNQNRFNIEGFGIVFNKSKGDLVPGAWRGGSFAISFNKVNEFHSRISYNGQNVNNDVLDYLVQFSNELNDDGVDISRQGPSLPRLAYNTYLTEFFSDGSNDFVNRLLPDFPGEQFPVTQMENIVTEGSKNQWNFSYGGNYNDRIYFGAGLGIISLRYDIEKSYMEQYPQSALESSQIFETSEIRGTGINATFGIIARPVNFITIGVSANTPTYTGMSEFTIFAVEANFNNFNYDSTTVLNREFAEDDPLEFDFNLTSPWRLNAGASVFIGKNGFISADVQWINYASMNLGSSVDDLSVQNNIIANAYENVLNYSIGGEARLGHFRLRAGYRYIGNPYQDQFIDKSQTNLSAGLGYRDKDFFIDAAITFMQYDADYNPYFLYPPDANALYLQQDITDGRYPDGSDQELTEAILETYNPNFVDISNQNMSIALTFGLLF
ncbi:MAG TPA: hypothetical protein DDY13_04055 [Cytophagales bacterium]|jgi:hypothetical protein|nr:hypothetical protein [Cytophagales bacterium]